MLVISLVTVAILIILIVQLLIPTVIMPLFYTFTDMEEGDLKTKVFKEAEKTKIPVSQIKVIDGS